MPISPTTRMERDAIAFLMDDHKRMQQIFNDFAALEPDDQESLRELAETACLEVQLHSILEEEIFYPAVRAQIESDDLLGENLLNQAEVEHEAVDELVDKLQELESDDAMYRAYFGVLGEYVKHHIGEEEKELFPKIEKMRNLDLQRLAADMRLRREELFAEIESEQTNAQARSDFDIVTGSPALNPNALQEENAEQGDRLDIDRTRH